MVLYFYQQVEVVLGHLFFTQEQMVIIGPLHTIIHTKPKLCSFLIHNSKQVSLIFAIMVDLLDWYKIIRKILRNNPVFNHSSSIPILPFMLARKSAVKYWKKLKFITLEIFKIKSLSSEGLLKIL